MTETRLFCDHCGKELSNGDESAHRDDIETSKQNFQVDLCADCAGLFDRIAADFFFSYPLLQTKTYSLAAFNARKISKNDRKQ